jgi:multidrug transporter EmrE-like cation transporter
MSWMWVVTGIVFSAFAQLGLRRISAFVPFSIQWLIGIAGSLALYGVSFVAYSFVLRHYKISVMGPLMTVGVVCLVVVGGMLLGETIALRQWIGVAVALLAIWFLLG